MGNFIIDGIGRMLICTAYMGFGYAWGVGALDVGTLWWWLWLFASSLPAAFGTTLITISEAAFAAGAR